MQNSYRLFKSLFPIKIQIVALYCDLFYSLLKGNIFMNHFPVAWQKGRNPANGPLQTGRLLRSTNLADAFLPVAVLWQKGMNPARGPLQIGRELRLRNLRDSFLTAGVSVWQNGINPANGVLQIGRLFRNLGEAFLPAAVEVWQNGSNPPRGPLQIGKELRSINLGDSVVDTDTGPAAASPAAINSP